MASQRKSGAALGYVNILAKNLVNLMYTPLLLHFLGQDSFGVFQMTNSVVFSLTILTAGLYGTYVRFYMINRNNGDEEGVRRLNGLFVLLYLGISAACLIGGAILIHFAPVLFSQGLTESQIGLAKQLMVVMVLDLSVTVLSTPFNAYIVANERFVFQQTRQLATTLAQPCIALALLLVGMGAVGVSCASLTVNVILLLLNARYTRAKLHMRFIFTGITRSMVVPVFVFSFWVFLNQVFDMLNNQVPNFLLGAMAGASLVATYSIAAQVRGIFIYLSTALSNVFIPKVNQLVVSRNDDTELTHLMTRVGRYQSILFCLFYGGFVVVGQYFVQIWAGKQNLNAYWLAVAMILPLGVPLVQNVGIEIQKAKNRHKMRSLIYVGTALLDVVIAVLLIPSMGYWGAAIGYIVGTILGTGLFMNWYYHTHIGLDMIYFWKKQFPVILSMVLTIAVCEAGKLLLPVAAIWSFLVWIVGYVAVYGALIWRFSLQPDERTRVLGMARKALHRK